MELLLPKSYLFISMLKTITSNTDVILIFDEAKLKELPLPEETG